MLGATEDHVVCVREPGKYVLIRGRQSGFRRPLPPEANLSDHARVSAGLALFLSSLCRRFYSFPVHGLAAGAGGTSLLIFAPPVTA
jgi:hypothetical protein